MADGDVCRTLCKLPLDNWTLAADTDKKCSNLTFKLTVSRFKNELTVYTIKLNNTLFMSCRCHPIPDLPSDNSALKLA